MTQDEALKLAEEFGIDDVGNTMFEAWLADPTLTREALVNRFSPKIEDKLTAKDSGIRNPLTELFGVSADKVGAVLNPRSELYWGNMDSKQLLEKAKDAGYVRDLPGDATESEKQKERENFGKLLNYLSNVSTDFERRNLVKDYENVEFLDHPIDYLQQKANSFLFSPTEQRMKELALKGEGPTGFSDMDMRDFATLGTDLAANVAFGAGGSLVGRGLAGNALRNYLQHYGSVAGAGALGGLAKAYAKDVGTENGARWYEYPSEAAIGALTNAIGSEVMLKMLGQRIGQATHDVKSVKGISKNLENLGKNQEMEAAEYLDDLIDNMHLYKETGYIRPEDAERIVKDMAIVDDGLSQAYNVPAGEASSYSDDLIRMIQDTGNDAEMFYKKLDNAIADARGVGREGGENASYFNGKADYLDAARRLMQNGVVGTVEMSKKEPMLPKLTERATGNTYWTQEGNYFHPHQQNLTAAQKAEIADRPYADILRTNGYRLEPRTANEGPIIYSDANKTSDYLALSKLARGVQNKWTRPTAKQFEHGLESQRTRDLLERNQVVKDWFESMPATTKGAYLQDAGAGAFGVIRAAMGDAAITAADKPETDPKSVERRIEKIKKEKPSTFSKVMNWQTDMYEPADKQLTPEERQTIDQWRVIQMRRNLLGGD